MPTPEDLPDDITALKRIAEMARDAATARAEITRLEFQLARYRRAEFGRFSEQLARESEQLELAVETLEVELAERLSTVRSGGDRRRCGRSTKAGPAGLARSPAARGGKASCRPGLPELWRRAAAHRRGLSETRDYVPGRFKVVRHIREKLSCRACDTIVAAPAPEHAIARGRAWVGFLAHIVVSKYDDHPCIPNTPKKRWRC